VEDVFLSDLYRKNRYKGTKDAGGAERGKREIDS